MVKLFFVQIRTLKYYLPYFQYLSYCI